MTGAPGLHRGLGLDMGGQGSGRHRLPPSLKVIRGTYRPDRDRSHRLASPAMPRLSIPLAPRHLSLRSRKIWRATCAEFELDAASLAVLRVALEALDRLEQARLILAAQDLVVTTPRGAVRPNPALRIEREARAGFLAAMGRLGLEASET